MHIGICIYFFVTRSSTIYNFVEKFWPGLGHDPFSTPLGTAPRCGHILFCVSWLAVRLFLLSVSWIAVHLHACEFCTRIDSRGGNANYELSFQQTRGRVYPGSEGACFFADGDDARKRVSCAPKTCLQRRVWSRDKHRVYGCRCRAAPRTAVADVTVFTFLPFHLLVHRNVIYGVVRRLGSKTSTDLWVWVVTPYTGTFVIRIFNACLNIRRVPYTTHAND